MGLLLGNGIAICGNFAQARRYKTKDGRPRDWFDKDYKAIRTFDFKWRDKKCGITCTCTEIIESYQPYYGWDYFHMDDCAIMVYYKKYPQRFNFTGGSPRCFASSE